MDWPADWVSPSVPNIRDRCILSCPLFSMVVLAEAEAAWPWIDSKPVCLPVRVISRLRVLVMLLSQFETVFAADRV